MKVCLVSVKVEVTDASKNKNAQKSAESDIDRDKLQVGFINPGLTMGSSDEARYMSLQRELVGRQAQNPPLYLEVLDSPIYPPRPALPPLPGRSIEQQDDGGYTLPQIRSSQDIVDSVSGKGPIRRYTLVRKESGIYEEIADDLVGEDVYEDVYESGYMHPLSQSDRKHESPNGDHKSPDPAGSPRLNRKRESYVTKL